MTAESSFSALAAWPPRDQAPADVGRRWIQMVERLQPLSPNFSKWYVTNEHDDFVPLALNAASVANAIAAKVGRHEDGSADPRLGYSFNAYNCPSQIRGPTDLQLYTRACANFKYVYNVVSLTTPYRVRPDPALLTFDIFKSVVLALCETFEATSAKAWSDQLSSFWPKDGNCPRLPLSWISYIGPAYAHLVTPPASAIVERRPDGGLLMAATDETFSVDDPAHMAVARDIAAAVAPFNALPQPLGDQTYDQNGWPIRV